MLFDVGEQPEIHPSARVLKASSSKFASPKWLRKLTQKGHKKADRRKEDGGEWDEMNGCGGGVPTPFRAASVSASPKRTPLSIKRVFDSFRNSNGSPFRIGKDQVSCCTTHSTLLALIIFRSIAWRPVQEVASGLCCIGLHLWLDIGSRWC